VNDLATRAAVLREFGAPQRVEEVRLRRPGPHEALVRITVAGVCHSDVGQADGEWDLPLPAVLGHEGAGVVEEVGSDVAIEPGTRVLLTSAPGCGRCRHCLGGRPILCQDSLEAMVDGRLTTGTSPISQNGEAIGAYSLLACFSNHAVVAERSLIELPDDIPDEVGALVGCAVVTGVGAAIASIEVPAGSRGAVIGAGGVGVNAIQGARARGATGVVAIDVSEERLQWAQRFGATELLHARDENRLAALRAGAPRQGFDWTIVTVGDTGAMALGIDLLRPGGTTAIVGLAPQGRPVPVDMLDLVTYERRVVGSAYGTLDPTLLVPRILELYRAGALKLDELVADRFLLADINMAFETARAARGLRSILHFDG
jgi:S-(hydroxymethyl)glutathione dehydrogenase / alcohol dehydrogenase